MIRHEKNGKLSLTVPEGKRTNLKLTLPIEKSGRLVGRG